MNCFTVHEANDLLRSNTISIMHISTVKWSLVSSNKLIAAKLWHISICSLAAELARANSAAPPPSPAGSSFPTLLLWAPRPPNGQALQEKPGFDQLPRTGYGPGDGHTSKPRRTESRSCVKAKVAACTLPSARAGEKYGNTHLPQRFCFWNAAVHPPISDTQFGSWESLHICPAGEIWTGATDVDASCNVCLLYHEK